MRRRVGSDAPDGGVEGIRGANAILVPWTVA
jgi:hypothetical protein